MLENIKLNESFAMHLVEQGVIDDNAALQALDQQRQMTQPIGRLALDLKYLTMKQVFQILADQVDSQMKFGELAITLGYLDNTQLNELLRLQKDQRPGLCDVLFSMGLVKKGVLQKERRSFLRSMEATLV